MRMNRTVDIAIADLFGPGSRPQQVISRLANKPCIVPDNSVMRLGQEQVMELPLEHAVISRRKFLKASSQAGVAIAATSTGLSATLSEPVDPYTAVKTELPQAGRRAQRSFEIRCDSARADTYRENPLSTTNGDEERYTDKRANYWLAL